MATNAKKYLDLAGLTLFWTNAKDYINKTAAAAGVTKLTAGDSKYITITGTDGKGDLSIDLTKEKKALIDNAIQKVEGSNGSDITVTVEGDGTTKTVKASMTEGGLLKTVIGKAVTAVQSKNTDIALSIEPVSNLNGTSATLKADLTAEAKNSITNAKTALTTQDGTTTGSHIKVVKSTNGHDIYTITGVDIASAQGLTDEIARAKKAEEANATAITSLTNGAVKTNTDNIAAINDKIGGNFGTGEGQKTVATAIEDAAAKGTTASTEFTNWKDGVYTTRQTALDNNIKAAKTTLTTTSGDELIQVKTTTPAAADGHVNYEITANGIAKATDLTTLSGKVTTLIGEDGSKSVRTIANEELAAQLIAPEAAESLNTLQEIAAWIQKHPDDAAKMNNDITNLKTVVNGTKGDNYVTASAKVDKVGQKVITIETQVGDETAITAGTANKLATAAGVRNFVEGKGYRTEADHTAYAKTVTENFNTVNKTHSTYVTDNNARVLKIENDIKDNRKTWEKDTTYALETTHTHDGTAATADKKMSIKFGEGTASTEYEIAQAITDAEINKIFGITPTQA